MMLLESVTWPVLSTQRALEGQRWHKLGLLSEVWAAVPQFPPLSQAKVSPGKGTNGWLGPSVYMRPFHPRAEKGAAFGSPWPGLAGAICSHFAQGTLLCWCPHARSHQDPQLRDGDHPRCPSLGLRMHTGWLRQGGSGPVAVITARHLFFFKAPV